MEKGLKKELFASIGQLGSLESYLERMALEGWEFLRIKGNIMYFRKIAPRQIRYELKVINSARRMDVKPNDYFEEEIAACKDKGWTFLQLKDRFAVFTCENKNVPSLHEDEKEWLEEQRNRITSTFSKFWSILLIGICVFLIFFNEFNLFSIFIGDGSTLFSISFIYLIIGLWYLIRNLAVKREFAYKINQVKLGETAAYDDFHKLVKNKIIRSLICAILFFLFISYFFSTIVLYCFPNITINFSFGIGTFVIVVLFIFYVLFQWIIDGNSKINSFLSGLFSVVLIVVVIAIIVIIMMFTAKSESNSELITFKNSSGMVEETTIDHYDIPFTYKDLVFKDKVKGTFDDTYKISHKTIFGTYLNCTEFLTSKDGEDIVFSLDYSYVTSKYEFLIDSFAKKEIDEDDDCTWVDITDKEGSIWGASKVYAPKEKDYSYRRIVTWKNKALVLDCDMIPINKENANIIQDKLAS